MMVITVIYSTLNLSQTLYKDSSCNLSNNPRGVLVMVSYLLKQTTAKFQWITKINFTSCLHLMEVENEWQHVLLLLSYTSYLSYNSGVLSSQPAYGENDSWVPMENFYGSSQEVGALYFHQHSITRTQPWTCQSTWEAENIKEFLLVPQNKRT